MGSGKTFFANVITEEKAKKNWNIYTNVNYFKRDNWDKAIKKGLLNGEGGYLQELPPNVHVVNKMSDLLIGLTKTRPNVVILDEAMIYAGYDRHGSKILRWFKDFVIQCRKLNTAIILITQVKSQLSKLLREQLEHYECFCQKYNGQHIGRMYKYFPNRELEKGPVRILPSIGHYPYDTKAPASLRMNVEMEGFLDDLSDYDSIELVDHIEELVNKWKFTVEPKKKKEKKETKTQRVKELHERNPDWTHKEIAAVVPCSIQLVNKII